MTDLELAVSCLQGHTLALCKNGEVLTSDLRGVGPMVDFLLKGFDLTGYSAADRVVGKAAALLFVKARVQAVFAQTISEPAEAVLHAHGVKLLYENRTARILNRAGTGFCPMESVVADEEDAECAFSLILQKLKEMRSQEEKGR